MLILSSLLFLLHVPLQNESPRPGDSFCNYARVKPQHANQSVPMWSSYRHPARVVGHLVTGTVVYVCDEGNSPSLKRTYHVFYGGPATPCGGLHTQGLDEKVARKCRSGWVREVAIEVLSG